MTQDTAIKVLEHNGMQHQIINGALHALDTWTYRDDHNDVQEASEWVDISDWSTRDLLDWLGY